MRAKGSSLKWMLMFSLAFVVIFAGFSKKAAAEGATASINTIRSSGKCTFTVSGLDPVGTPNQTVTIEVMNKTTKIVSVPKKFEATSETITESFTLSDLNYEYAVYAVTVKVDGVAVKTADCDFSIHTNKLDLSVTGAISDAKRTFNLNSTESSGGVLVPGSGNKVSIYVWNGAEADAAQIGTARALAGSSVQWKDVDITTAELTGYGVWHAKAVLTNSAQSTNALKTLATATYSVEPKMSSLTAKTSTSLENKQTFKIQLSGLQNAYPVQKVSFAVYDSANKKVGSTAATASSSNYTAEVKYKDINYTLDKLSVKATITDSNGKGRTFAKAATIDLSVKKGKVKVKRNKDATCDFTLTGAYIPGSIDKVKFVVYLKKSGKYVKQKGYTASASSTKKKYAKNVKVTKKGTYRVKTYAYTAWGKKILFATNDYKITKEYLGKNGWVYEKVNGKKYKFYYKDNEKVKDLTKILKIRKSSKMYIEVNRAAAVVTFYLYNPETKKYDIPVKAATVSVGRDVSTVAGAGSLNIHSSFTPIGSYSATNRYSLKPMHEPDGSTVYARWCTHIVGNVYFHSIAVHSQSHYALSARSYGRLGGPASAGCVRMTVADAKWLYDRVASGTPVKIVKGNKSKPGPLGKPATIKISGVSYDPTDPAVPDSRKKADYKAKKISGYMTKKGVKVGYK